MQLKYVDFREIWIGYVTICNFSEDQSKHLGVVSAAKIETKPSLLAV